MIFFITKDSRITASSQLNKLYFTVIDGTELVGYVFLVNKPFKVRWYNKTLLVYKKCKFINMQNYKVEGCMFDEQRKDTLLGILHINEGLFVPNYYNNKFDSNNLMTLIKNENNNLCSSYN